jgi:NAD+ diphosphatase
MSSGFDNAAQKFGPPLELVFTLESLKFPPVSERAHGEVCMAIRRKNGRILLQTKESYPNSVMRLPSGGINPGEDLEAALLREIWEETNLEVAIRSFIARLSYTDGTHHAEFQSNLFLSDEVSGVLGSNDPSEKISDWLEVEPENLLHYAASLQATIPSWKHWGRFRSAALEALFNHCQETQP